MPPGPFEPTELLRVLIRFEVDFIIVGGVAGTLAGSPVATQDLDVVYSLDPENVSRLAHALETIGALYKDPAGRRIAPDVERLATFRVNLLTTELGDLDLLRTIGPDRGFDELFERTIAYDLGEFEIRAIDVETLIEAKELADRPKDRYALPFLRELLRLEREGEPR